jgi:hypothetical protein
VSINVGVAVIFVYMSYRVMARKKVDPRTALRNKLVGKLAVVGLQQWKPRLEAALKRVGMEHRYVKFMLQLISTIRAKLPEVMETAKQVEDIINSVTNLTSSGLADSPAQPIASVDLFDPDVDP